MTYEHVGELSFPVEYLHHGFIHNSQNRRIRKGIGKTYAQRLAGEATLAEEVAFTQNTDGRFFSIVEHDRELDLTVLYIEYRVTWIALGEDALALSERQESTAFADRRKEDPRIKAAPLSHATRIRQGGFSLILLVDFLESIAPKLGWICSESRIRRKDT